MTVTNAVAPALGGPARIDVLSQFVTAYGASLIGCTVVRMRGLLVVNTVDGNGVNLTAGAYIGDSSDITEVPDANDNYYASQATGRDYMMVEPFFAPDAAQVQLHGSPALARLIDVRAQRKLDEVSQRLIIDVSSFGAVITAVNFGLDISVLLMLH